MVEQAGLRVSKLRSVTAIPAHCNWTSCGWEGVTGDCDSDDEGDLICPMCRRPVEIEYNEHELNPGGRV